MFRSAVRASARSHTRVALASRLTAAPGTAAAAAVSMRLAASRRGLSSAAAQPGHGDERTSGTWKESRLSRFLGAWGRPTYDIWAAAIGSVLAAGFFVFAGGVSTGQTDEAAEEGEIAAGTAKHGGADADRFGAEHAIRTASFGPPTVKELGEGGVASLGTDILVEMIIRYESGVVKAKTYGNVIGAPGHYPMPEIIEAFPLGTVVEFPTRSDDDQTGVCTVTIVSRS